MAQETFSNRLRQAMSDRDVRQSDVIRASEMLGKKLGKSQMSQYVSGKTIPRRDVAELLARILEVDVTWLLAGDADQGEASSSRNVSKPEPHPSAQIPRSTTMRTFSKSTKLENVLYDVRGPVVDEAARMEDEGERILKLNIGNPAPFGFRTPDEVIKDMRQQLPDCEGYSNSRGLFSARKAIMQYSQIKGLPNVQMEHIYTGNGVSELIQLSMNALLDNGDEILIPSPDYPLWTACATLAGGHPVHYLCDEQADWYPDLEDMESKITSATKALVIQRDMSNLAAHSLIDTRQTQIARILNRIHLVRAKQLNQHGIEQLGARTDNDVVGVDIHTPCPVQMVSNCASLCASELGRRATRSVSHRR